MSNRGKRWKRPAVRAAKVVLAALIVWMVGRALAMAWDDLRAYGRTLRPSPAWLLGSAGLYLLGLGSFGMFFARIMGRGGTPVGPWAALRAYLIGHLGKYVPGKAMVVVLRVGLVVPFGARAATAAFATLYETLVMMASGGLLAGVIFLFWPGPPIEVPVGGGRAVAVPMAVLSLAIGGPLLVLAEARIFPKLALTATMPFAGVGREALPRFSAGLLGEGLAWSLLGWALMGLSLAATLRAIDPAGPPVALLPLAVAAVALATVAGFLVAIFPGGLVIREAVLTASLGPALGAEAAIVAALVLRLVWVAAELACSGACAALRPRPPALEIAAPAPISATVSATVPSSASPPEP